MVNCYEADFEGLSCLDLDDPQYSVLDWIAVLLANRMVDFEWNVQAYVTRFLERYSLDISTYDVVSGYRADDSYYSIARAFISGSITDAQLAQALRLGQLGRQVAFRSREAVERLEFLDAQSVDARVWGKKRMERDARAREEFRRMRMAGEQLEPEGRGVQSAATESKRPNVPEGRFIYQLLEEG